MLTLSMICLMVWRRMIPELRWSVPASLGSLSGKQDRRDLRQTNKKKDTIMICVSCNYIYNLYLQTYLQAQKDLALLWRVFL